MKNWYKISQDGKKREDFTTISDNNISNRKTAQSSNKPYKIVCMINDEEQSVGGLSKERIYADSAEEARTKFFKSFPRLRDYYEMGWEIEARPDFDMINRQKRLDEIRKQQEEEALQNAWWNK